MMEKVRITTNDNDGNVVSDSGSKVKDKDESVVCVHDDGERDDVCNISDDGNGRDDCTPDAVNETDGKETSANDDDDKVTSHGDTGDDASLGADDYHVSDIDSSLGDSSCRIVQNITATSCSHAQHDKGKDTRGHVKGPLQYLVAKLHVCHESEIFFLALLQSLCVTFFHKSELPCF